MRLEQDPKAGEVSYSLEVLFLEDNIHLSQMKKTCVFSPLLTFSMMSIMFYLYSLTSHLDTL